MKVQLKPSDVIKDRGNWTKGALAKTNRGHTCGVRSREAEKFCLLGAIKKANNSHLSGLAKIMSDLILKKKPDLGRWNHIPKDIIIGFNDDCGTKHSEVLSVLTEAENICLTPLRRKQAAERARPSRKRVKNVSTLQLN